MRHKKVEAGEWVQPRRKNYYMQCCDCGLVHRMNFRILKNGRGSFIQFQAFRATRRKRDAIRAERERCANIAESMIGAGRREIADAIRRGEGV